MARAETYTLYEFDRGAGGYPQLSRFEMDAETGKSRFGFEIRPEHFGWEPASFHWGAGSACPRTRRAAEMVLRSHLKKTWRTRSWRKYVDRLAADLAHKPLGGFRIRATRIDTIIQPGRILQAWRKFRRLLHK